MYIRQQNTTLPVLQLASRDHSTGENYLAAASYALGSICSIDVLLLNNGNEDLEDEDDDNNQPMTSVCTMETLFPLSALIFSPPTIDGLVMLTAGEGIEIWKDGLVVGYCEAAVRSRTTALEDQCVWNVTSAEWSHHQPDMIFAAHRYGSIGIYPMARIAPKLNIMNRQNMMNNNRLITSPQSSSNFLSTLFYNSTLFSRLKGVSITDNSPSSTREGGSSGGSSNGPNSMAMNIAQLPNPTIPVVSPRKQPSFQGFKTFHSDIKMLNPNTIMTAVSSINLLTHLDIRTPSSTTTLDFSNFQDLSEQQSTILRTQTLPHILQIDDLHTITFDRQTGQLNFYDLRNQLGTQDGKCAFIKPFSSTNVLDIFGQGIALNDATFRGNDLILGLQSTSTGILKETSPSCVMKVAIESGSLSFNEFSVRPLSGATNCNKAACGALTASKPFGSLTWTEIEKNRLINEDNNHDTNSQNSANTARLPAAIQHIYNDTAALTNLKWVNIGRSSLRTTIL